MLLNWTTSDEIQRSINCYQIISCDYFESGNEKRLEICTARCGYILNGNIAAKLWNQWLEWGKETPTR